MKRFLTLSIFMLLMAMCSQALATGSCTRTSKELIQVDGRTQRVYITLTCTGDGTIAAYTFNPTTEGVRGMYLYNATTTPGTSAPTADYDITLVANSEDIAGGLLADRSDTLTQTVRLSPTTLGYHMLDGNVIVSIANETANPSTFTLKLRFTVN